MKIILQVFSIILIFAGLIPLIKKDYWTFRVFDYPRFQKLILSVTALIIWLAVFYGNYSMVDLVIIGSLILLVLYLSVQVFPFTPFSQKMIQDASSTDTNSLHLLVSNVFQDNRDFEKIISLIKNEDPDVFLLVETDQKWAHALSIFKDKYPYHIEKPLENTYGMLFYSRLKILKHAVNYLIDKKIPSLELDIELEDGQIVKMFGLHPTPPVPGESTNSTARDAEILIVGEKAKTCKLPCVVFGDLNDVGWSHSSELFLKISGLLDPRRGRGMFNTFHVRYPFFRWPLDHIFVSKHFTLQKLKVHRDVGSDHFPISTQICLEPLNGNEDKTADFQEQEEADQKIKKGETEVKE